MAKPAFAVFECDHDPDLGGVWGGLSFSADGQSVISMCNARGPVFRVARWDVATGAVVQTADLKNVENSYCLSLSPNGRMIALGLHNRAQIMDAQTFKEITALPYGEKVWGVNSLAWSMDETRLAAHPRDLCCWDVASRKIIAAKERTADGSYCAFLPGGHSQLLIGESASAGIWSLEEDAIRGVLKLPKAKWYCTAHVLSADGATLLSIGGEGQLARTNTKNWKSDFFPVVRSSAGYGLALSPDGKRLAIHGSSGTLLIWDVDSGQPFFKWGKPNYHGIRGMAYSPDGSRLALGLDGELHILDFRPGAEGRKRGRVGIAAGKLQCVQIVGGDDQMDLQGGNGEPLNPLPTKCTHCSMPNLDYVPGTYVVGRGTEKPTDMAPAEAGNFLVRSKVMRILETVAPGQCEFISTIHQKTKQHTDWFLAVPKHTETTATPPVGRERCPKCGEPWCFHYYTESQNPGSWSSPALAHDISKSKDWGSHKEPFKGWGEKRPRIFGRRLYFSLRIETLLKKLKLRGLIRAYECKAMPSPGDLEWVVDQLRTLERTATPSGSTKSASQAPDWFTAYLAKNSRKKPLTHDFSLIESEHRVQLPQSYKEFATRVGTKRFKKINEEEGLEAVILLPKRLDFEQFANLDDEAGLDRAVVFAETNSGDTLCFDVTKKTADPEVYWHNHETDEFEPFAKSFAECVRLLSNA